MPTCRCSACFGNEGAKYKTYFNFRSPSLVLISFTLRLLVCALAVEHAACKSVVASVSCGPDAAQMHFNDVHHDGGCRPIGNQIKSFMFRQLFAGMLHFAVLITSRHDSSQAFTPSAKPVSAVLVRFQSHSSLHISTPDANLQAVE